MLHPIPTPRSSIVHLRMLALLFLAACSGATHGSPPPLSAGPTAVPLFRLQERAPFAYASGFDAARTEAIRTKAEWQAAWSQLHGGMTPLPPAPVIDFSKEMLVLVAVGEQPSGGFGVTIREATRAGSVVTIHAIHTKPGMGCAVTMALTQPVDIVRLATRADSVVFDLRPVIGAPCP